MPRPRQRRGADAKKEEKQAKREKEEQEARAVEAAALRERHRKKEMDWNALPSARGATTSGGDLVGPDGEKLEVVDPDALPEVDADTKAYFKEVADKIGELEALGHGKNKVAMVANEEEEVEDERPLLLRSSLESLMGHEIPLAGDPDTSIILERLLFAMDDFARRVLGDRFMGQYDKLVRHRNASHVLQTLFMLAGETVDRETRGIIAPGPQASTSVLPMMTELILAALSELLPFLPTLIYDQFGSHAIRILLLVLSGRVPSEGSDGAKGSERSKKSRQFRGKQGPMKSFLDDGSLVEKVEKRVVPASFTAALQEIETSLLAGLDDNGPLGEGVRRAAMDDVAGPVIRILIELESESAAGWTTGGWADRVLCGLVEEVVDASSATEPRTELRAEYLGGLLRHPASSPTFESILLKSSSTLFSALWSTVFRTRLARLAGATVANFVVAVGLTRVNVAELTEAVEELDKVGRERRGEWIDNSRTGVLRNLLERCAELKCCEKEACEMLLDTFQLEKVEDQKSLIPCVLSLNRLEYFKKLPAAATSSPSVQGSILLQSWFKLASPYQQVLFDSIASLGYAGVLPLTRDPISSRVLDSLLSSPSTLPRERRRFLLSLIGNYHTLADDRIGSRVVERCWTTADVFLKDKIAASLVDQSVFLQQSHYGHFFARKLELPLWGRAREVWKLKMAAIKEGTRDIKWEKPAPIVEEKKRRERPVDEIDELFARGPAKRGKPATVAAVEPLMEEIAMEEPQDERVLVVKRSKKKKGSAGTEEGMDVILAALKGSV